jgi:hypothetical protein
MGGILLLDNTDNTRILKCVWEESFLLGKLSLDVVGDDVRMNA